MSTPRKSLSALYLTAAIAATCACAAGPAAAAVAGVADASTPATDPSVPAPAAGMPMNGGGWHHHPARGLFFVLRKLDLSADQKARVKTIFAGEKSQFEALRASARTNRQALAATPPTDPGYPALIQTAQTNAATRIKLESEAWTAIYSSVLTPPQQQAVPGIVAAAEQAREAREAEWRTQHAAAPAPAED